MNCAAPSPFNSIIDAQGFVLLDGGLATELEHRGHDLKHRLWSARLLIDEPHEIEAVHRSFLEAGADCIATATYQASTPGFVETGLSEKRAEALIRKAVKIAVDTRDDFVRERMSSSDDEDVPRRSQRNPVSGRSKTKLVSRKPLVAASIGPYGAYLADGSEYRGDYQISDDELRSFHAKRLQILADTPADLFAFETVPSFREAVILIELLGAMPGRYAWISFSCRDGTHISDGTPLIECVRRMASSQQIVGIGVNCVPPEYVPDLIKSVQEGTEDTPVVVYPNSGETYDAQRKCWSGSKTPGDFGADALDWFNLGARIIGGCCRTGPEDIARMKDILSKSASGHRPWL